MKFFLCSIFLFLAFAEINGFKMVMKGGMKMDKGFFKDLDKATKEKFFAIMKNKDLTKRQVEQQLDELVAELSAEQQQKYQAFKQKKEEKIQEIKNKVAEVLPTLSPESQELARAVQSVLENQDITLTQQREQLQEIKKNAPAAAKQELKQIFKSFKEKNRKNRKNERKGGKRRFGKFGKSNENNEMPTDQHMEPFNQDDFDVAGVVVGF